MTRIDRLQLLQRQVAWQTRYALTLVEDLEEAAEREDVGAACYLLQAFTAACLTLSHQLWPGGRRITDQIAISSAAELRASLDVDDGCLLARERIAPLGITVYFTHADCVHFFDLRQLVVEVDGEDFALRPLMEDVQRLWERTAGRAGKVPAVLGTA